MYLCLHGANAPSQDLFRLALEFSPVVEQTAADTVVFSIAPLRKLIGSPHQIASEVCRFGYQRKLQANLAVAANPDTAILLASNLPGVTLVTPGEEHLQLATLPLSCLFRHRPQTDSSAEQVLYRWGLKTCGDLAVLPEKGVVERLGKAGIYLHALAAGRIHRPLHLPGTETNYQERLELDHPVSLLEPLLFLFARVLNDLCRRLRSQSRAARLLTTRLELENRKIYLCDLEFPVPLDDSGSILKLLQLHLERHSPESPILAFTLRIEPAEARRVQGGFFVPPTPPPDKIQITLARIAGMVGKENVGTPLLLDTYRPDAFTMSELNMSPPEEQRGQPETLRLVMRLFRPALQANVTLSACTPKQVAAPGVKGDVIRFAGPWKTCGEWWTTTAWSREEWDIALDNGTLYRIYQQSQTQKWFVQGIYD